MNIQLLIVDPQNDFVLPTGSLSVAGAEADMTRLAAMINRIGHKLDDIVLSADSHHLVDVGHPIYWRRVSDGTPPAPFTILGVSNGRIVKLDPANGMSPTTEEYTTRMPSFYQRTLKYLEALYARGRYPAVVWPPHCLIGSFGHNVYEPLLKELQKWESDNFAMVTVQTKGSNPYCEHYSLLEAEVPDPGDPSTQLNTNLVQMLDQADVIAVAGEARSHCVYNSVVSLANAFPDSKHVEKIVLLTDAMSDVPGFDFLGNKFYQEMKAKGANFSTTVDFLK